MSLSSIRPIAIEDELKNSYLDYAMSVIVSRALPDVRDGLKPVHRRVLFAMNELGNDYNKAYKKSARVVGDVIGKYHPHGDSAVYETIVRMAQDFSLRYLLVDGQGNFGSVDGDSAAAMRYTEIRMTKLTHELLADLDKDTVDWVDNYDGSEKIPAVLPTRVPNLLINGSAGIAVGMATNMAPHNLNEVIHACLAYVDDPQVSLEGLMQHISGPDFPTGGLIYGRAGIYDAYRTGKGRVLMRGKYHIEQHDKTERQSIVFTEIPYQVNKAKVIERIAELVKEKKIDGISELRDESDKDGMRIVIDLKRGENSEIVVNHLFLQTPLQSSFSINMVCLDDGQPKLMNLKDLIAAFIRHRQEVVTRRTFFELRKARERGHLLEGLTVALSNIDAIIEAIKTSANPQQARERLLDGQWQAGGVVGLLERAGAQAIRPDGLEEDSQRPFGIDGEFYRLSPLQVGAILELRLHRLTGLEQDKLHAEYSEILKQIVDLQAILDDFRLLMDIIRQELQVILQQYGDARRTEIVDSGADFCREDLIPETQIVLTVSKTGYAKIQPLSDYAAQKRGGRGKSATSMKEDDYIHHLLVTSNHSTVLFFTSRGKVYKLRAFEVPVASRGAKGRPMVNLLPLEANESITAILPFKQFEDEQFIFMATASGTVKRIAANHFVNIRSNGLRALELSDDDTLIGAALTDGQQQIMLFSNEGKAIRFAETDVRAMGRTARGVRGMRVNFAGQTLLDDDADLSDEHDDELDHTLESQQPSRIVSLVVVPTTGEVLCACAKGYGKRTPVHDFPTKRRGGKGIIAIKTSDRNGELVGAVAIDEHKELLLISNGGTLVRTRAAEIATTGRNAQGVRLIRLGDDEVLVGLEALDEVIEDDFEPDLTEEALPETALSQSNDEIQMESLTEL